MGSKTIAATLVVLVGAIATYDINFFMSRAAARRESTPEIASAVYANDVRPAERPRQLDAVPERTQPEAAPSFRPQWSDPFAGPAAEEPHIMQHPQSEPDVVAHEEVVDPFRDRHYTVSAVLIGSNGTRAIVNGCIVTEGDYSPQLDATVTAITPRSVELGAGSARKTFPVAGSASRVADKQEHSQ